MSEQIPQNEIKNKRFSQPPRVGIYYIYPIRKRRLPEKWYTTLPIVTALLIGFSAGAIVVWQTSFGEANREAETAPLVEAAIEQSWSKPLDYNQDELNIVTNILPELVKENRHEPTAEEIKNAERKAKLKKFLAGYKSPFAKSDKTLQAFLDSKNMKLMLAISFVESSLGKKCYYNNCSGIGGYPPNLRKYPDNAAWVEDFDSLLERRYKGVPIEKFMGLYVQPGSPNWINGVKQILAELKQQGIE